MAKQYRAFISYTHHDERWAKWLQRGLERYRIPKRILDGSTDGKQIPRRLQPIFRDRDELATSSDLSDSIRSALDRSDALIVLCSPEAARSKWVSEEVRHFRTTGRGDRIFCLLISGSPDRNATDCAFTSALLFDGDQPLPEPLAADIDPNADGKRGALLKVVAGLLGVGIDDLKQRDAQRRLRVRGLVTSGSLMISLITIGLAITAQVAREEAEVRRDQAEGLIRFMLGDLRSKLEPVGRLDLLDAVGDEAMAYFAALGDHGTAGEILARAMALRQIGEVRFREGRLIDARKAFEESRDLAQTLHASNPKDTEYLFELGQAEFWVGYAALEQGALNQTQASFTRYMEHSRQLLAYEPDNPDYQLELMYAYSNLGTTAFESLNLESALDYFQRSVALAEQMLAASPDSLDLKHELGNGYSWVGAAFLKLGRLEESETAYRMAYEGLMELHESSGNRLHSEHFGQNSYHLANVHLHQGEISEARALIGTATDLFAELANYDPDNAIWQVDLGISLFHSAELAALSREFGTAQQLLERVVTDMGSLLSADSGDWRVAELLALSESMLAQIALKRGLTDQALSHSENAQSHIQRALNAATDQARTTISAGRVAEVRGRVLLESGDGTAATSIWREALSSLNEHQGLGLTYITVKKQIAVHLRLDDEAEALAAQLSNAGFRDPRY